MKDKETEELKSKQEGGGRWRC